MTSTAYRQPASLDGHPEVRYWTKGGPVDSEMLAENEILMIEERQEASMSEPAAMALFGFAVGTFIVAYPIAGFLPMGALTATIPPVLLFAGIAQFIGGLIAFRRNNAFAGTAFCAYGANNAVIATLFLLQATGTISAAAGTPGMQILALELYCFAVISLVLAVAAMRLNLMFTLLLLALVPGFTLPGIVNWFGAAVDPFIGHLGGYFLIASAAIAGYSAAAMLINSTWEMAALPLIRLGTRDGGDRPARRAAARPAALSDPVGTGVVGRATNVGSDARATADPGRRTDAGATVADSGSRPDPGPPPDPRRGTPPDGNERQAPE